ncbi:uncharacterized protein LOC142982731 [Anticarsia gemmatalis]|uniref:uncharacterized protein LOC142982731 n=1 Tax=Anticarsia gemmatalis TaxID=129554 RepID=UPI003F77481B
MAQIATYVFVDLETTSLPNLEHNQTRITELCMLAVKRRHILDIKSGLPRVQHKLTLCFNPGRTIAPGSTEASGLDNDLLEHESRFNINTVETIKSFLDGLEAPVCLIAHNGHKFDFPILRHHFEKLNSSGLFNDVMCADSLYAFYDLRDGLEKDIFFPSNGDEIACLGTKEDKEYSQQLDYKQINERTPSKRKLESDENDPELKRAKSELDEKRRKRVRKLFYDDDPKPDMSFRVQDLHDRIGEQKSKLTAHRAESDCIMVCEIAVHLSNKFVEWVDDNHYPFEEGKPMTPGVPLGF